MSSNNKKSSDTPPGDNAVLPANNAAKNTQKSNNKKNNKSNQSTNNKKAPVNSEQVEVESGGELDFAYLLGKKYLTSETSRIILVSMIAIIIFLVLIYLLYHFTTGRKVQTLHNKVVALYNDTSITIPAGNMKPSFNNKQSYIIYINFDNSSSNHIWYHSFQDNKMILRRVDDNFRVKYNPHTNKLVVDIKIKKLDVQQVNFDEETGEKSISSAERQLGLHETYEHIYVPNIPHQKWLQIAILIDNRLVDIYLNTKLAASRVIQNVPISSNSAMLIGQEYHNPNAYVGRVEYTNDILSTLDLKSLYHKNMRFLKVDPVLRDIVSHEAYELQAKLGKESPSPS